MKSLIYIIISIVFFYFNAFSENKILVGIHIDDLNYPFNIQLLNENGFDICGFDNTKNEIHVLVDQEGLELIYSFGLFPEIIYHDANVELRQSRLGEKSLGLDKEGTWVVLDTTLGPYHTFHEMKNELLDIASANPSIVKLDTIGYSIEGRLIIAVKISDNVHITEPDEPEVLFTGNHHAREVISVEIPMDFINQLVQGYNRNTRITEIINKRQIWIIPMLNPDGHVYVEKYNLNWRKNRRDNGDGTYGVDLNRNYDFKWGLNNQGSSPNPSAGTYRGTAPFSEPEAAAIRDFVNDHSFVACFSYHAYGSYYIYPWNYFDGQTPDHDVFVSLSNRLTVNNNYVHGNSWATINYLMNGEATDWMYGVTDVRPAIFALTVEVGIGEDRFFPDTSRIRPLIEQNREANLLLAEFAGEPQASVPKLQQPVLSTVAKSATGKLKITWESLSDPELGGYRIYSGIFNQWSLLADESILLPGISSFNVPIRDKSYYKIVAVDTAYFPGLSYESDVYGASPDLISNPVLIVDGFDRKTGSWYQNSHYFVYTLGEAVSASGRNFESCDNEAVRSGAIDLNAYPVVIWISGDESTQDSTFTPQEQIIIKYYLENGGNLFVSGSEIGWDLVENGSQDDRLFYVDYFKSIYQADDANIRSVVGAPSTIFEGLNFGFGNRSYGSPYYENYPDIISTNGGSVTCLLYSGINKTAAIQYEGIFGNGTIPGKLVYCAFPFETIHKKLIQNEVMNRILDFFEAPLSVDPDDNYTVDKFELLQNYPNPFNGTTMIQFILPEQSHVKLVIYDISGREIIRLVNEVQKIGSHSVLWNGQNNLGNSVASGVYFYVVETRQKRISKKMLIVR